MHANRVLRASAPWYRHRWPWFLMIGPALVLAGGVAMIWLASTRPDAMVVGDYYRQGKAINQELRRDREATRLGLAFASRYDPRQGLLRGRLLGHGKPVAAPFHIRLAHPTQPGRDRVLEALPDAGGRFTAAAPRLEATHWQVVVEGGARNWRLAGSWDWSKNATLALMADAP